MSDKGKDWAELMLAGLSGDEAAYNRLLSELALQLRPFVKRNILDAGLSAQDIEDVVQETLIALHIKRHTWRADAPLLPWLNAIVRYKVVDAIRRSGGRQFVPIDDLSDTLAAQDEAPALARQDIVKMAASLPAKQQAVVIGMFVDGETAADTASRLAMTEGAVRVILHRALGRLAKQFGKRG